VWSVLCSKSLAVLLGKAVPQSSVIALIQGQWGGMEGLPCFHAGSEPLSMLA
jgi:hypothetical protein